MSTINFACKKVSIENVIRCGLGLNKTGYKIFKVLLNSDELDINEISTKISKDRTTVQRVIKTLVKSGIVFRRQVNLDSGGFMFYYSIKSKEEIKKRTYENFCNWKTLVEAELKKW